MTTMTDYPSTLVISCIGNTGTIVVHRELVKHLSDVLSKEAKLPIKNVRNQPSL